MNVYETVTSQMIAKLSEGTVPWRKPWQAAFDAPRNLDGRLYRGINVWTLLSACAPSPIWMTYRQATDRGGHVLKGEHGLPAIFYKVGSGTGEDEDGNPVTRKRFILQYFTLFNLSQTEGVKVPAKTLAAVTPVERQIDPINAAEAIIDGMPDAPAIIWGGGRAFYRQSLDEAHIPPRTSFDGPAELYSTVFHELGHSTGHAKRLGRPGITDTLHSFGDAMYSREELVAEMVSAFLCGEAGISPDVLDNQAAYVGNWIAALRADSRALVIAAGQAQKAADLILARMPAVAVTPTIESDGVTVDVGLDIAA